MPKIREDASRRIDEYIGKAADFARPICERLREIVHRANPAIVEDWKWGPNFNKDGMVCGFGAFKKHVTFTFFKGSLIDDPACLFNQGLDNKGGRGIRLTSVDEIDEDALTACIREAVAINERGEMVETQPIVVEVPADLEAAFDAAPEARAFFDALAPGYRRDYTEWIESAQRPATREKRIRGTIEKQVPVARQHHSG